MTRAETTPDRPPRRPPGRILGHHLMYEIRATTTAISRGARRVVFTGKRAYTDNKTITIPHISPTVEYEPHDAAIMRAYSAHEAAHSRETDWHALEKGLRSVQAGYDPETAKTAESVYAKVSNIVDDMFIERRVVVPFPGTWPDLALLRGDAATRHMRSLTENGMHRNRMCVAMNLLLETCNDLNGWPCQPINREIVRLYEANASEIAAEIASWRDRIDAIETSTEGYALSEAMTRALLEMIQDEPEEEERDGEDDSDQKAGNGMKECEEEGEGPGAGSPRKKMQTERSPSSDDVAELARVVLIDVTEAAEAIAQQTRAGEAETKKRFGQASCHQAYVGVRHVHVRPDMRTDGTPTDQSIARSIRRLALATSRDRPRRHRDSGDFDHRNVIGQALGSPDVYMTIQRSKGIETALRILVDTSGSTAAILEIIASAALSVAQASTGIGSLAVDIRAYTDDDVPGTKNHREVVFTHLKEFEDNIRVARAKVETWLSTEGRPSAGTPTAEALLEAGYDMLRRSERRRILLLVTDGKPNNVQSAQAAAHALRRKGVLTCLLEIGVQAIPLMDFEHAAVATDDAGIAAAMESIVASIVDMKPKTREIPGTP